MKEIFKLYNYDVGKEKDMLKKAKETTKVIDIM